MLSGDIGTWPAIVERRTTLFRTGPATPRASGTPATVWQPAQPFATTSRRPRSGSPSPFGPGVRGGSTEPATDAAGGVATVGRVPPTVVQAPNRRALGTTRASQRRSTT